MYKLVAMERVVLQNTLGSLSLEVDYIVSVSLGAATWFRLSSS